MIQKTFVEVNEKGTEAAAATALVSKSAIVELKVKIIVEMKVKMIEELKVKIIV